MKKWTKEEIDFLKENYLLKLTKDISIELKRTESSISKRLHRLGLHKVHYNPAHLNIGRKHDKEAILKMKLKAKERFKNKENHPMFGKKGEKSFWYGKKHKEKTKKLMSETLKRLYKEGKIIPTFKKGYIPWNKGKFASEQHRKNLSKSLKNNQKFINSQIKKWRNPEYKENQIKIILKGLLKRPTSFEQKISDLCFKYNLPFLYKGDGNFLINFKNPDFVNEKDKVVIEVFYSYFKIRDYGSIENYKEFCRKKYEPLGWKVIFIDENDLNTENWEEICLNKIKTLNEKQLSWGDKNES